MISTYYECFGQHLKGLNLADAIINEIIQCFTVKKYVRHEYFASNNQLCDKIGFVVNGLFHMSTVQQDGKPFTKQFIKNNQFLLAVFDPKKESKVDIQSIKDSILLEAKYSDIQLLFSNYHEIETISKKRIESETEAIYNRMTQYATTNAIERYILFKEEYSNIEAEIPQFLIASYLGITPTQLSRIKAKLKLI